MKYQYNRAYEEPYEYNGGIFQFDPNEMVPVPEDHEDFGKTLKDVQGMSDSDCERIVTEQKWIQIRKYRDGLLVACDWTQGADVPDNIKTPWADYRKSLRDITDVPTPDDVEWPLEPNPS
jgi:hypothetical protein